MRKDGIQTRKRKPKKSGNGTKPPQDNNKKDDNSSPGLEGTLTSTSIEILRNEFHELSNHLLMNTHN